jgi:hypothetical protein
MANIEQQARNIGMLPAVPSQPSSGSVVSQIAGPLLNWGVGKLAGLFGDTNPMPDEYAVFDQLAGSELDRIRGELKEKGFDIPEVR